MRRLTGEQIVLLLLVAFSLVQALFRWLREQQAGPEVESSGPPVRPRGEEPPEPRPKARPPAPRPAVEAPRAVRREPARRPSAAAPAPESAPAEVLRDLRRDGSLALRRAVVLTAIFGPPRALDPYPGGRQDA